MNLPMLLLAVFALLEAMVCLYLFLRLRRAEAGSLSAQARYADNASAANETTAIDQILYDRCCRYMTEHRPFLVETFSLQDLANAIYTNKLYLSRTINRFSGKNFKQYVNYYRIMYSMEVFRRNMNLRVSDMASLSGFHSDTSFLQNFKSVMGETPSAWCDRMRKKQRDNLKT